MSNRSSRNPAPPAKDTIVPGGLSRSSRTRIPLRALLKDLEAAAPGCDGIVATYRERVLPVKTRTIQLLGRKGPARIMETLLGYEVQASYKRIQCPDMVTARYLKLFSEIGCRSIRLPYDPTVTAELVPLFERSQDAIVRGVRDLFHRDRPLQLYVLREIFRIIRAGLAARPRLDIPRWQAEAAAAGPDREEKD